MTGHLVLSTVHTNDALSSFTRLIDMGMEPFLVTAFGTRRASAAARPDSLSSLFNVHRQTRAVREHLERLSDICSATVG